MINTVKVSNIIVSLLFALHIGFCSSPVVGQKAVTPSPKYEMRGVWLTTIHGLDWPSKPARNVLDEQQQQRELIRMLDELQSLGINTVFLQVRGRGDLIYPSEIEPMSHAIAINYKPKYDPLEFAIRECHRRGMGIHAWLVVMPLGAPQYWRTLGSTAYARTNAHRTVTFQGHTYMDPADSGTGKHMRRIVRELLTKYDLEGIHLDYIRYPDRGKSFPDQVRYRQSKSTMSLHEWRRHNISGIVKEVYDEMRMHSSSALLSAATIGAYSQIPGYRTGWTAREDVFQDPVQWDKGSYIDFIVPMHYTKGSSFVPIIEDWKKRVHVPIVIGLGAYRILRNEGAWSVSDVSQQTLTVQGDNTLGGMCYFRAKQITPPSSFLHRLLKEKSFRNPVLPHAFRVTYDSPTEAPLAPEWLELEDTKDGMMLKWKNRNQASVLFAVYARSGGQKPDLSTGRDLIAVTAKSQILIPDSIMSVGDVEDYLQIEVSAYDLKTGAESYAIGGAAYYRRGGNYLKTHSSQDHPHHHTTPE